jgi:hypothetical protein
MGRTPWSLEWLTALASLSALHTEGCGLAPQASIPQLSTLRHLHARITCDDVVAQVAHLTGLETLEISFGRNNSHPSPTSLAHLLSVCRNITCLHFTFAQSFAVNEALVEALGSLTGLRDLQINSFDLVNLNEADFLPLARLTALQALEFSGVNRVGTRCSPTIENNLVSTPWAENCYYLVWALLVDVSFSGPLKN